jgi:PAS domain-containing protein
MISKYPIYDAEKKISGIFGLFIDITERTKNENLRKLMETAFLNNSSTVLYVFNSKFKLVYLSDSFQNVFGYEKEKHLEDKDFWLDNCLHPDYREKFLKYRQLKEWPKFLQYRGINSKKQTKWLEANSYKFTYLDTECLAYIERDISSQKSLVWKNIAMYEIINKLPNTIVWSGTFNDEHKIQFDFITENIEQITGYSKNDVTSGKVTLYSMIEEKAKNSFDKWRNNDIETLNIEHKIQCKNGKNISVNTQIFSIINQDDNKTYFGMHTIK